MKKPAAALAALAFCPSGLAAQARPPGFPPPPTGGFVIRDSNNTGGVVNVTIPRGATGADTYMSNSAAGGNVARPELAVPNGSAGGASGGSR